MPYTQAWNEAIPAGSSAAAQLDDRIRDLKTQIRERLCDIFGLDLSEFQDDPILPRTLILLEELVAILEPKLATPAIGTIVKTAAGGFVYQSSGGTVGDHTFLADDGSTILTLKSDGSVVIGTAVSKLVMGSTSLVIRNHADTEDIATFLDDGTVQFADVVTGANSIRAKRLGGSVASAPVVTGGVGVSSVTQEAETDNSQGLLTFSVDSAGGVIAAGSIVLSVAFNGGGGAYNHRPAVVCSNGYSVGSIQVTGFNIITTGDIPRNGLSTGLKVSYIALGV